MSYGLGLFVLLAVVNYEKRIRFGNKTINGGGEGVNCYRLKGNHTNVIFEYILTGDDQVDFSADRFAERVESDAPVRAGVGIPFTLGCLQEQQRSVGQQGFADAAGHVDGTAVPEPPGAGLRLPVGLAVERGRFVDADRRVGGMFDDSRRFAARNSCKTKTIEIRPGKSV